MWFVVVQLFCLNDRLPILQGGTFSLLAPTTSLLSMPEWECPAWTQNATLVNTSSPEFIQIWQSRIRVVSVTAGWAGLTFVVKKNEDNELFPCLDRFRVPSWWAPCSRCWWDSPVLSVCSCGSSVLWQLHLPFHLLAFLCSTLLARKQEATGESQPCGCKQAQWVYLHWE